jgi:peptidoglycan/xylan/chitin deacetylase (PgdA/CDA1 family)
MDKPAFVSLTFDDGFRCQFDKGVPILRNYGFLATFFLIANQNPTHDSWSGHTSDWWKIDWRQDDIAMLKQLVKDGHEIGSHSVTHHPKIMPTQPEIEVRDSKKMIEDWIGAKVHSFCYPFYHSRSYLASAAMNAGYDQARGGASASFYSGPSLLDRFNIDCRQISRHENVAEWLRPGCWHVLTFHGIGGEHDGWEPVTVGEFTRQMTELAKYRDSSAVEIVAFKNGIECLRQSKGKRVCGFEADEEKPI